LIRRLRGFTMALMSDSAHARTPDSPQARGERGVFVGQALANRRVCENHYLLRLRLEAFPPTRPGQFVQLQCRELSPQRTYREVPWPADGPPRLSQPELAGKEPLLRRPLSLAGRRDGPHGAEIDLIYRAIGIGTHWLSGVSEGTPLSVLGPLGNAFPISATKTQALAVGGGVGIPPMLYLCESLSAAGKSPVAFCGARTRELLPLTLDVDCFACPDAQPRPCAREFADRGAPCVVATDDGSAGFHGLVSQAMEKRLDMRNFDPLDLVVYTCGPELMMRSVAEACLRRGIECHVALERHMACGVGTCQSCACKVRAANERGWEFKLCCSDGPVFDARDIVW
jgi:dihydroorotate dehydrogenase electron transfer subunit